MIFKGITVKDGLSYGKKILNEYGIESWSLDADLIMTKATGLTRVELFTKDDTILSEDQWKTYINDINRRKEHEPTQYILNNSEFMGLDFYVDKNVLIPRGDTECITEYAITHINYKLSKEIMDLCTGSGCIGVSVAYYCKDVENVDLIDISENAINIAKKNAKTHGVLNKTNFIVSDMFENVPDKKYDIIISNPPYIIKDDIPTLQKNVKDFEPIGALDGGLDGNEFYKIIADRAKDYLNDDGRLYLEIGYLKEDIMDIFKQYKLIGEIKDLKGLDRGLIFGI